MRSELEIDGLASAIRCLESKDYEILETDTPEGVDIVAKDLYEDALAFISVTVLDGTSENINGFPKEKYPTDEDINDLEIKAMNYLKRTIDSNNYDMAIRFDEMIIVKIGEGKALARHHINITGR